MVETALILPLVLTMLFGVIELSMALSARHAVSNMSRGAARYGASLAKIGADTRGPNIPRVNYPFNSDDFDMLILSKMNTELVSSLPGTVTPDFFLIYRACQTHRVDTSNLNDSCVSSLKIDSPALATDCTGSSGGTPKCMRYNWNSGQNKFVKVVSPSAQEWDPFEQDACYDPSTPNDIWLPEKLGVYVQGTGSSITGMLGPILDGKKIYQNTIVQLEPRDSGHCANGEA